MPFLVTLSSPAFPSSPPFRTSTPANNFTSHDLAGALQDMQVAAAAASMRGTETVGAKSAARRLSRVLVGRRRRAAVLLLALAYAAAMLMLTIGGSEGSGSSGVVAGVLRRGAQPAPPGSVYRSHLVFERLLPEMRAFASRPNPVSVPRLAFFAP